MTRTTSASPETVFDLLTDHAAYASMTPLRSSRLIREGSPDKNGVGARRRLGLVGPPMVEEVVTYERPHRFAYTMLSGLPVRDHLGDVRISAGPAGTLVDYRVTSHPKLPLGLGIVAGPVLDAVLRIAIKGLLDGIVKAAEGAEARR